jgi:hypothetical protein
VNILSKTLKLQLIPIHNKPLKTFYIVRHELRKKCWCHELIVVCIYKGTFTSNSNLKSKLEHSLSSFAAGAGIKQEAHELKIEDPTLANKSEMSTTVLLPPVEMSPEEQRALGYMPLRDDFEREYKNDGEQLLSNLNIANNQLLLLSTEHINAEKLANVGVGFGGGDAPGKRDELGASSVDADDVVDFELKLCLMEMYRECLQERQRFKKIAREYGLVNSASALLNKQKVNVRGWKTVPAK